MFSNNSIVLAKNGRVSGSGDLFLRVEFEGSSLKLAPPGYVGDVEADYVYANKTYALIKYPASFVKRVFIERGVGKATIDVFSEGVECEIYYDKSKDSLYFGECRSVVYIVMPSLSSGKSVYDVVFESFNSSVFYTLRTTVFGSNLPPSEKWVVWSTLAWVGENIEYDDVKALLSSIFRGVYDPLTTLMFRRGVCVDIAVFTAATLLSSGVNPVYILTFNTTNGSHAVAAVMLDGSLWILDQRLPVVEWSVYRSYVANVVGDVYVYEISYKRKVDSVELRVYKLNATSQPPRLSSIRLSDITPYIIQEVSSKTGMIASPTLAGYLQSGYGARMYLSLYRLDKPSHAPLSVAFSDSFREQWVSWLAEKVIYLLNEYYPDELYARGYFWLSITDEGPYTVIAVIATRY